MIKSGRPRAAAATASRLKQPSNATVLCYQHGCLSGSLTHARTHAQPSHLGRGRSSFPAQPQLHMEVKHSCMKLRNVRLFTLPPLMLRLSLTSLPTTCTSAGEGAAVRRRHREQRWRLTLLRNRRQGWGIEPVVLTGQWTFSRSVMSNSTLSMHLLYSRRHGHKRGGDGGGGVWLQFALYKTSSLPLPLAPTAHPWR